MLVNKPVVLQGNIQVDNEWFVYNNPQVYMAMNSGMEIQSNKIIIVNDSKLLGCIDDWKGIKADGSDKRIIVNNGSTIRDMNVGIQLYIMLLYKLETATLLITKVDQYFFRNERPNI
ncbi:MAG: hypothetical protein IPG85_16855 [Bacteroidetes bacterium]|nr:hypothetical protein [Bacteroidota bacterium]